MEGKSLYKTMNPMIAYQKGLTTWAKWIDLNLDPRQTRVIFRSMSPRHNRYPTNRKFEGLSIMIVSLLGFRLHFVPLLEKSTSMFLYIRLKNKFTL